MDNSPEGIGGGLTSPDDRFNGQLNYRPSGRRDLGGLPVDPDRDAGRDPGRDPGRNGSAGLGSVLDRPVPKAGAALYERPLGDPPVPADPWPDAGLVLSSAADHPLVRGLMMELPPRGTSMPSREWLDRWFEAARSILELIYTQDSEPPRGRR